MRTVIRSANGQGHRGGVARDGLPPGRHAPAPEDRVPHGRVRRRGDKIVPPAESEAMAKAIPGAKWCGARKSGHVPMLEEPDLVAAGLLALAHGNPYA
jgi:pimeloyl-ACP methyl ester carboxylesterase